MINESPLVRGLSFYLCQLADADIAAGHLSVPSGCKADEAAFLFPGSPRHGGTPRGE